MGSSKRAIGDALLQFACYALFAVLIASRGACASADRAVVAAEKQGYADARITDIRWFFVAYRGCGGDAMRVDLAATNPVGKPTDVYVCLGWPLKGATVRSD